MSINKKLKELMLSSDDNYVRLIGYDNAHSFKSKKKYGAKRKTYDHMHKQMDIVAYEFESGLQLLEDFWKSVEYYMENNK